MSVVERPPAFEAHDISVHYDGVCANDDVSVTVAPGEIVGLIGPNGAGKTTFVDAVTGFVPSAGSVRVDGRDVAHLPPHRRARRGLARTWQSIELFPDLSVVENLLVVSRLLTWRSLLLDLVHPARQQSEATVCDALSALGLADVADRPVSQLSLGDQKLVGIARALALRPRVVLLDEPAAGLDTEESRALGASLRTVADSGVALLLIDHDMDLVLTGCDRVHVLDMGRVIASGSPQDLRADHRVVAAYLGTQRSDAASQPVAADGDGP